MVKLNNPYCKLNKHSQDCELWQNGLECPDCQNCTNYRILQILKIGDTVEYVISKIFVNKFGGLYAKEVLQTGKIVSGDETKQHFSVKSVSFPYTVRMLSRNDIRKV